MLSRTEEKRGAPRYPLERLAKIQFGHGIPSRYCVVTDISGGGVRINAFGFTVPDEFILQLSGDGPAQDGSYKVVWRLGYDVGAKAINSSSIADPGYETNA